MCKYKYKFVNTNTNSQMYYTGEQLASLEHRLGADMAALSALLEVEEDNDNDKDIITKTKDLGRRQ